MCSNFQPIKNHHANWVMQHFGCELPNEVWRPETYPTYPAPFVCLDNGQPKCGLAQFGLVPHWASDIKKFGLKTYNARSVSIPVKRATRYYLKVAIDSYFILTIFERVNWGTKQ